MQKWWMIFDLLVLACLGYPCEAETDGPSRNVTPCAFQLRFRKKDSHPCGCVWKWGIPPTIAIFHGENDDWPMGLGVPHFNPRCWWGARQVGQKMTGAPWPVLKPRGKRCAVECRGKETVSLNQIGTGNQTWLFGKSPVNDCTTVFFFGKPST